jgi:hypothetical protein
MGLFTLLLFVLSIAHNHDEHLRSGHSAELRRGTAARAPRLAGHAARRRARRGIVHRRASTPSPQLSHALGELNTTKPPTSKKLASILDELTQPLPAGEVRSAATLEADAAAEAEIITRAVSVIWAGGHAGVSSMARSSSRKTASGGTCRSTAAAACSSTLSSVSGLRIAGRRFNYPCSRTQRCQNACGTQ